MPSRREMIPAAPHELCAVEARGSTDAMSGRKSFYVTTPIYYPNGEPHFGHAYTSIACDVMARFARLDDYQVYFVTGTDEHGLKMKQSAVQAGIAPQELADRNSARFRELFTTLAISNDDFIRTTEPRHYASCQELWRRMADAGDIYLDTYAGWYSVRQEAYFKENETTVGADGVRREPLGSPVEWTEEQTYRFRLSRYGEKLLAHYDAHPEFILPLERRNEVVSFVKSGLEDLSISRATLDWGIPVPGDPTHVMYVWADALTNYITAVGFPDENIAALRDVLAGRRPRRRQGHRALSRRLLARVPDVGGHRAAETDLRARPADEPRREDVEIGRQRRRSRSRWRASSASIRCAISRCAKSRSATMATTHANRSSIASTPISPTISAIWHSARCR